MDKGRKFHTVYELVIPEEHRTEEAYRYIGVRSANVAFLDDNYWGSGVALKGMGMKDIAERFVLKTFATRNEAEEYETLMQKKVDAACNPKYLNRTTGPRNEGGMQGTKHTPEAKAKIGKGNKGNTHSAEAKAKISKGNKGKKHGPPTPETRAKISKGNKGKKQGPPTPETRAKMSKAHLGKKHGPPTPETRAKISKAHKGKKQGPHTPETRAKISKGNKERVPRVQALAKEENCTYNEASHKLAQNEKT